jgi:hypothetical protein
MALLAAALFAVAAAFAVRRGTPEPSTSSDGPPAPLASSAGEPAGPPREEEERVAPAAPASAVAPASGDAAGAPSEGIAGASTRVVPADLPPDVHEVRARAPRPRLDAASAGEIAKAISPGSAGGHGGRPEPALPDAALPAARPGGSSGSGADPGAPPPPGTGLLGEYWKLVDQELTDFPSIAGLEPTIRRVDPGVAFPNGGAFGFSFLPRNFAARWRGFLYAPEDGDYGLVLGADDGGWLFVDGAQTVAIPGLHPFQEGTASTFLSRGFHSIEVRFFQNEGPCGVVLSWMPPVGPSGVVPRESLYPPGALTPAQAPRITAVTPPRARGGEPVEIDGQGFPEEGPPNIATFDGVPFTSVEVIAPGRLRAILPAGVDRGDIIVGDSGAPSQGFPYETGDTFGLLGEYTSAGDQPITTLAAMPPPGQAGAFRRVDPQIAFGSRAAFALPFPAQRFAARFTGSLYARDPGSYAFRITSDDGSRLSIDGAVVADDDGLHGMQPAVGTADLSSGFHAIEIDFFQNEGPAGLTLEWTTPGAGGFTLIPRRALYAPPIVARAPPEVDAIDPPQGAPGDAVSVLGRGFVGDGTGDRVVFTQNQAAEIVSSSPTRIVVRVPARAQSGPVIVQSGELSAASGAPFTVLGSGLSAAYYHFDGPLASIPSVSGRAPTLTRIDPTLCFGEDLAFSLPFDPDHFAAVWTGAIAAPADGTYNFALASDDGSRLFVDGAKVIENDGIHGYFQVNGAVDLTAGSHAIRVEFFENEGVAALRFFWQPPGRGWQLVPQTVLVPQGP